MTTAQPVSETCCVISHFTKKVCVLKDRQSVGHTFSRLAANIRFANSLVWDVERTFRNLGPMFKAMFRNACPLNLRSVPCPETSVTNNDITPVNILEERRAEYFLCQLPACGLQAAVMAGFGSTNRLTGGKSC